MALNINLDLAKKEYVLVNGIYNANIIKQIKLFYRDVNKLNQAVFDVYTPESSIPISWALVKLDTTAYSNILFPSDMPIDPITVTNFINRRTNVGMVPGDIAFINPISNKEYQVMISLDSMYFSQSFILRTA